MQKWFGTQRKNWKVSLAVIWTYRVLKRDQTQHLLIDSNSDFLSLTETWLTSHTPTTMMDMPAHACFLKVRPSGKGGGVLVYLRDIFKCTLVNLDTPGLECLVLNVVLSPKMNFNIITLYIPPKHNVIFYQDLDNLLKLALNHTSGNIVMGDFNINRLDKHCKMGLEWDNVLQTSDVDRCCDILTNTVADIIQKFTCPLRFKHKKTLPRINNDIYQLKKKSLSTKLHTDHHHHLQGVKD